MIASKHALAVAALAVVTVALAISALAQAQKFAIPIPIWLPLVNIAVCINVLLGGYGKAAAQRSPRLRQMLWLVSYAMLLMPWVLATYAGTYLFEPDINHCRMESRWAQLFRSKDEATIRWIQGALHCCGFNSSKDRAWPFPSSKADAGACEATLGFSVPCGPRWQRRLHIVAALNMTASLTLVLVSIIVVRPRMLEDSSERLVQARPVTRDERARLLAEVQDHMAYRNAYITTNVPEEGSVQRNLAEAS